MSKVITAKQKKNGDIIHQVLYLNRLGVNHAQIWPRKYALKTMQLHLVKLINAGVFTNHDQYKVIA